jgi:3-oxoadipate enol-lactonase
MKADIGGLQVHYEVEGQGPWLTLSHPISADLALWAPQMEALARHFTVLRYDTRGHGQTQVTPAPYTLAQLARDTQGLLAHLGIARTHWIGLSMGGMIGQALAVAQPQLLDRVVLANTTCKAAPNASALWGDRARMARTNGMVYLVEPTLSRWFTLPYRAAQPTLMQEVARMITRTPVEGYAGCCAALAEVDLVGQLQAMTSPALVLAGAQDQATPLAMSQLLADSWPGARLAVLQSAAHISSVEQPEAFNREMLRFLLEAGGHMYGDGGDGSLHQG